MSDTLPMPVESAVLAETRQAVSSAYDADLLDRCVDLKLAGLVRWDAIHRRLNAPLAETDEQVAPEAVQACLQSQEFASRLREAQQDPEGWKTRRLRAARMFHVSMNHLDARVQDEADKRTQMQAITLRLGLGGHTPQTQVAVGPNEDFLRLVEKALTKRNGTGDAAG